MGVSGLAIAVSQAEFRHETSPAGDLAMINSQMWKEVCRLVTMMFDVVLWGPLKSLYNPGQSSTPRTSNITQVDNHANLRPLESHISGVLHYPNISNASRPEYTYLTCSSKSTNLPECSWRDCWNASDAPLHPLMFCISHSNKMITLRH